MQHETNGKSNRQSKDPTNGPTNGHVNGQPNGQHHNPTQSQPSELTQGQGGESAQQQSSSQPQRQPQNKRENPPKTESNNLFKKLSNLSFKQQASRPSLSGSNDSRPTSSEALSGILNTAAQRHAETLSNGPLRGTRKLLPALRSALSAHRSLLVISVALLLVEGLLVFLPHPIWQPLLEVPISLAVAIAVGWLASSVFRDFFDIYLLDAALREGRKLNSELLILAKVTANGVIVITVVILFAQTHQINIVGLLASLGIGGLAVAFAAQRTLEQLLGGIVLYLDRPFVVDDYVGLPDGTFGRVEAIGLRSTKIRTSGKGTLMIIPNSSLTQVNIENFTGAKKVMSIIYLNFFRAIEDDEKALIRQVILESTQDIFGIDSRSTDVTFRAFPQEPERTQVQVTFFILGSGELSMELRRQVLDLAYQNVRQRLMNYGLRFEIEEPMIYVDSPITI